MLPPHLRAAGSFACLLFPATILAWFHHTSFPAVVAGAHHLWRSQKPLPVGFEILCRFGFLVYLPLLLIVAVYALSWRFAILGGSLSVALCAGFLGTVCVFYAILLTTPLLAHGLLI